MALPIHFSINWHGHSSFLATAQCGKSCAPIPIPQGRIFTFSVRGVGGLARGVGNLSQSKIIK